jgi:integrase
MSLKRQAKVMTPAMEQSVLMHLEGSRYPTHYKVRFLLSIKAGLRAVEIASLTWSMITDASGDISTEIALVDDASKGNGGRIVPLNKDLKAALVELQIERGDKAQPNNPVVYSERGLRMTPHTVSIWFNKLYKRLGLEGCTSHSGRRTFATRTAKAIIGTGGSLKDIQELLGHASLQTTQRYIQGSETAKAKVVDLI